MLLWPAQIDEIAGPLHLMPDVHGILVETPDNISCVICWEVIGAGDDFEFIILGMNGRIREVELNSPDFMSSDSTSKDTAPVTTMT